MRIKHFIKTLFSVIVFITAKNVSAQDCPDLFLMEPVTQFNNPTLYPAGSLLYDFGAVKLYNVNASDHPTEPTVLDSIIVETPPEHPYRLFFKGRIKFDFSDFPSECKYVRFGSGGDSIIVDGNPFKWTGSASLPHYFGDSIRLESANGIAAVGRFNTITFTQNLATPYAFLTAVCVEECPDTSDCSIDFDFDVNDSIINFNNLTSLNPDNTDMFEWNFPNGDRSTEENPTHTIAENGTHNVCLNVVKSSCLFSNTTMVKCQDVEIDIYNPDYVEENDHYTLTPNDDGIQDYVDLKAGSKIFDRNGSQIIELYEETQWTGTGVNNLLLPTGLYTILHEGSTFQVTLIR